jgi:acyl carrier protein
MLAVASLPATCDHPCLPCRRTPRAFRPRKDLPVMKDNVREFLLQSLKEMNYSTEGIADDTVLGPAGADLQSLALAELAVRVEDQYGVRFDDDEAELLAGMTVGEFSELVAQRAQASSPS